MYVCISQTYAKIYYIFCISYTQHTYVPDPQPLFWFCLSLLWRGPNLPQWSESSFRWVDLGRAWKNNHLEIVCYIYCRCLKAFTIVYSTTVITSVNEIFFNNWILVLFFSTNRVGRLYIHYIHTQYIVKEVLFHTYACMHTYIHTVQYSKNIHTYKNMHTSLNFGRNWEKLSKERRKHWCVIFLIIYKRSQQAKKGGIR